MKFLPILLLATSAQASIPEWKDAGFAVTVHEPTAELKAKFVALQKGSHRVYVNPASREFIAFLRAAGYR